MEAFKKNSSGKRRGNIAGTRSSKGKKNAKNAAENAPDAGTRDESDKFNSTTRPLLLLLFLAAGILLFAAFVLYDVNQDFLFSDDWLKDFAVASPLADENPMGKIGATLAVLAFNFLGLAAFMLPVFLLLFAFYMARFRADISIPWKIFLMIAALCSGATLLDIFPKDLIGFDPERLGEAAYMPSRGGPGGALGKFLFGEIFKPVIGSAGSAVLLLCIYFFCVLGLVVSAPQRTIANLVTAIVEAMRRRIENRRRRRELRARQREEAAQAQRDAQEQLRRNSEAQQNSAAAAVAVPAEEEEENSESAPAAESAVPAEAEDSAEALVAGALDGVPEPLGEIDTSDADFSDVPVDETAVPVENAPVFENLDKNATLTPTDFESDALGGNGGYFSDENLDKGTLETGTDEDAPENPPDAETPPKDSGFTVTHESGIERGEMKATVPERGNYVFPPISLLAEPKAESAEDDEDYEARGQIIINELASFKCPATLVAAHVGPTITRYEIKPGVGVRAERILNLQNNVAMALQAQSARLASVPEHGTIGVEVPNRKARSVLIREVLESRVWCENKMEIPAVLGKDVTGKPVLIDLAKMPHGLIAGSSGSGKSVCLNGLITSILYHASPEEVRLVMIDPKVVELKVYNDAPHMLIPVITDMKRAPGAIKWLIDEMERRYKLLEEAGVRNIVGYNAKIEKDKKEAEEAAKARVAAGTGVPENGVPADISVPRDEGVLDELRARKKMSYIVCIIDEFGDLMAQNAAEIETGVHRLTAKARAAGIHLILATQRPDAKTVTGLIKANLGTRIGLRVTSGTNSRIILDEVGAETLIGRGDMLVLGPGSPFPQRAQGVWVSEEEIEKIVNFLAEKNGKPKYADDVTSAIDSYAAEDDEDGESGGGGNGVADARDELVGKAWDIIRTTKRASISNLQRKLGIGYNRAAKIIDILEEQGKIGPELGPNKPREIYE